MEYLPEDGTTDQRDSYRVSSLGLMSAMEIFRQPCSGGMRMALQINVFLTSLPVSNKLPPNVHPSH